MTTDWLILKGKTFRRILRWQQPHWVYAQISNVRAKAPCEIEAPNHGIPDGYPVAIAGVRGMKQINAENNPPRERDFYTATRIDDDNISLNAVNASRFTPYAGDGHVMFHPAVDLTGCTARLQMRASVNDPAVLLALDTTTGGIELLADGEISISISATDTAALTWKKAVFELEVQFANGDVTRLLSGTVRTENEVTR